MIHGCHPWGLESFLCGTVREVLCIIREMLGCWILRQNRSMSICRFCQHQWGVYGLRGSSFVVSTSNYLTWPMAKLYILGGYIFSRENKVQTFFFRVHWLSELLFILRKCECRQQKFDLAVKWTMVDLFRSTGGRVLLWLIFLDTPRKFNSSPLRSDRAPKGLCFMHSCILFEG